MSRVRGRRFSRKVDRGYYDQELLNYCKSFEVQTLKEESFKAVVANFPKYNAAYHSSEDKTLRRNLYYLRKNYSARILQEFAGREWKYLNPSYFDFLVNEFLKEIRVGVLHGFSEGVVLKKMAEIGSSFEKVHIDKRTTPFMNELISHLPNVENLLIETKCDDETIRVISSTCHRLRTLRIKGFSSVSDEGVKQLVALDGTLKHLSLKFSPNVEGDGVSFLLENLPSLEALVCHQLRDALYKLYRNHLLDGTLSQLRGYNLTTLNLNRLVFLYLRVEVSKEAEIFTICSELCPHLKKLTAQISSERHLEIVSHFRSLETLSIGCYSDELVNLDPFLKSSGRQLKRLKIYFKFVFTPSVLVKSCPNLMSFQIGVNSFRTELNADDLKDLQMPKLQHLTVNSFLSMTQASEACLNLLLDSSPNLETLTFRSCDIKDSSFYQKLYLYFPASKLNSVTFCNTDIDYPLLNTLLDCDFLKTITVQLCATIIPLMDIKRLYDKLKLKRKYVVIKYDKYASQVHPIYPSSGSSEEF